MFGEARLLQRLPARAASHALHRAPAPVCLTLGDAQTGRGPGLLRAIPLDPGQPSTIRSQHGRRVEVGPFDEDTASAVGQREGHQPVHDTVVFAGLFQGDDGRALGVVLQITVTAAGTLGQRCRQGCGFRVSLRLQVDLLVRLVDEGEPLPG